MPDDEQPDPAAQPDPEWSEADDPDGLTLRDLAPRDVVLEALLDFTLGPSIEIDDVDLESPPSFAATFNTHGLTVSGIVVHPAVWANELTSALRSTPGGGAQAGEFIEMVWRELSEASSVRSARREAAGAPRVRRGCICMREVTLVTPGQWVKFPLWRLRIKDVNGWSLGQLSTTS